MRSNYVYERPAGVHYKVSIKEWGKVFAKRGRWPFVVANVYLEESFATVHYNISLYGKVFMWLLSPVHYLIMTFMYGYSDAHKGFLDCVFDKQRGSFSSDVIYKYRGKGKSSESWNKLMKLVGRIDEENKS